MGDRVVDVGLNGGGEKGLHIGCRWNLGRVKCHMEICRYHGYGLILVRDRDY